MNELLLVLECGTVFKKKRTPHWMHSAFKWACGSRRRALLQKKKNVKPHALLFPLPFFPVLLLLSAMDNPSGGSSASPPDQTSQQDPPPASSSEQPPASSSAQEPPPSSSSDNSTPPSSEAPPPTTTTSDVSIPYRENREPAS